MSEEQLVASKRFRDRIGWIVAFGIFEAGLGLLIWAIAVLMLVLPMPASTGFGLRWRAAAIPGVFGTALLVAAIGSIRRKDWGRVASLVLSSLWLFYGLCSLVVAVALFPAAAVKLSSITAEQHRELFWSTLGLLACAHVLLPGLLLLFYSRKSVRAMFLANSPPGQGPRRPFSIVLLSGSLALGVFALLSSLLLSRPAATFFGLVLHGPLAVAVIVMNAVVFAGIAWVIWRQRTAAWWAALLFSVFWSVSGAVPFSQPELPPPHFDFDEFLMFQRVSAVLFGALFVGLLLFTRRHFQPPISSPGRSAS